MNLYFIGNMFNYASLLMIASGANCISLKNGQMNLGGEGQVYFGGFITAIALNFFYRSTALPSGISFFLVFLICILSGIIISFVSGILKLTKNANELLTTYLISSSMIPVIDSLIGGRFRLKTGNLIATEFIDESFRFKKYLPPSSLNFSLVFGIFICLFFGFLLYKTRFGKRIEIFGKARTFAIASGFSKFFYYCVPLCISSVFHCLAGFFAITGTYYTCHQGFFSGIGWNALSVSLIAGSNPLKVIFVSVIYSFLYSLATQVTLFGTTGFDISSIIQGLVLFVIAFFYKNK